MRSVNVHFSGGSAGSTSGGGGSGGHNGYQAGKGGTGGTFSAAATKAGYDDSPSERLKFAKEVLAKRDSYSPKMVRKANFYKNIISKKENS